MNSTTIKAIEVNTSETTPDDLPEGWVSPPLGSVLTVNYGKGLKESLRKPGPVPVYGSNGLVGKHHKSLTDRPAIIIGRKGTVGAVHLSLQPCWPIDTTYFIAEFHRLDPLFVAHGLRTLNLQERDTSTAIPGLNRNDLYAQPLPLAPLAEQHRIVASVEELFKHVNASRDHLAKVPKFLKAFRQSVLSAACSGHLTEEWREGHPPVESADELLATILKKRRDRIDGNRASEPMAPDEALLTDFPQKWTVATMDQLTCFVTSGSRGWAKYYSDSGPYFIRAENINTDVLRTDNVAHVRPPGGAEGRRTRIALNDLLLTITGANVTKSALVDRELKEAYVSQHVALVRPVDPLTAQYLFFWIISPSHGRAKLTADAYGAGKPGLNLDNIREMNVALPPFEEHREIVRRVEALFKLADTIGKRVEIATKRADKLTQAVLAKAFRGELVPTEAELARREGRDYEPASVLLDRIRAARQAESEKPKTKQRAERRPGRCRDRRQGKLANKS
jgi:type I restriction enzyme S subunit